MFWQGENLPHPITGDDDEAITNGCFLHFRDIAYKGRRYIIGILSLSTRARQDSAFRRHVAVIESGSRHVFHL